jgi:hypothetical protein
MEWGGAGRGGAGEGLHSAFDGIRSNNRETGAPLRVGAARAKRGRHGVHAAY